MSQEQTLQDIYSKIADLQDLGCDSQSDPITFVLQEITIESNSWSILQILFDNPDDNQVISDAQTDINDLLVIALQVAQEERSAYDATFQNTDGSIVPIPKGSPIMLLPKLIRLLVGFRAPIKFLVNIIIDFIQDILLEHIKRKLSEKKAEFFDVVDVASTRLIKIPKDAEKMIVAFNNLPDWVGKRFEPNDLNKDIIQPPPSITPDLSKFILSGLGTVNFGLALTGSGVSATVFWGLDIKLEYRRQIFDIPIYADFTNYQRYAYLYLEHQNTCTIGFFRRVSAI
jgi:hypothetical protein